MVAFLFFMLGTTLVFYILAGYPAILAFWPGRRRAEVQKDLSFRTTVSVLLAVHNGAAFIQNKLESLLALDYPADLVQILVISDGSTDGTDEIVEQFAARGVRLLRITRGGKAQALNAGLAQATGEILFFTDVRQPLEPQALAHLVANFADPTVGAATGELRILDPETRGEQADMELYWRFELWARRAHSQIDSIFSTTGCIYALRRSLAEPLRPDTLTDDATFSLKAFFLGYRVIFDSQAIAYDYPTAPGGEFRRKLRSFPATVTNGQLAIQFTTGSANMPMLNALQVVQSGSGGSTTPAQATLRVNAGGPSYKDASGQTWAADTGFSGGSVWSVGSGIRNTPDSALYQSCRWGNFSYTFPVQNGNYTVTLKFAEPSYFSPGQRVFNVSLNGTQVLSNFDVLAQANGNSAAIDKSFGVSVTGGQIAIQFNTGSANFPMVNAIQITPN